MSYRGLVLLQKPTFYLPFEEASGGTASDVTGNGFDGVYNNVSLASASGFSVFGGSVTNATWNGSTSQVTIAKRWLRSSSFSFSGWVKASAISGWRQLIHLTNCTTGVAGPALYVSSNGDGKASLSCTPFNGSNTLTASSTQILTVGEIAHFAVVVLGSTAQVYKNGVLIISYTNAYGNFPPSSTVLPMVIGAGYASSATITDFFAGWISNFAAWDRPLTSSEVLQQYNVGKQSFDQPYISGTVLDNGSGTSKRVLWVRRDSGVLVAAGTSASDGSFTLKTTTDVGTAICLDDASTNYAPLVYDRVTPQT